MPGKDVPDRRPHNPGRNIWRAGGGNGPMGAGLSTTAKVSGPTHRTLRAPRHLLTLPRAGWRWLASDLTSRREWRGHYEARYRAVIVGCGAERRPGRGVRGVGGSRRGERADRSLRRGEAAGVTVRGWRFLPG